MWRAAIVLVCMHASLAHAQVVEASAGLGVRDVDDDKISEGGKGMTMPNVAAELAIGGHVADSTILMGRIATTIIPVEPFVTSTLVGPHAQFWIAKDIFVSATVGGALFVAIDKDVSAYLGYGYGLQMGGPLGPVLVSVDYASHHFGHPHGEDGNPTKTWGISLMIGHEWR